MNIDLREYLPTAVRAWTVRAERKKPRRRPGRARRQPQVRHAIVVDTETRIQSSQQLMFGAFRYVRLDGDEGPELSVTTVVEGLIYPDDLPSTDHEGFATLQAYARSHKADVDMTYLGVEPEWALQLMSRSQFADRWIYRVGYRKRALLVMFNAPFDLSRLAAGAAEARDDMYGGFSLMLWTDADGKPAPWRPRVAVKAIDSKRALKKFRHLERDARDFAGHILDLRTLVFALTGDSHNLNSACGQFGVPDKSDAPEFGVITPEAIDYGRQDVHATTGLLGATLAEYGRHPIELQATEAYSPASIAKSYLQAMGIKARLKLQPDFPTDVLGFAMSAFYGGRSEVNIRHTELPVALVDVTSMYPTVDILMELWAYVVAERIDTVDATSDVQAMLDTIDADTCYRPNAWPDFVGLAQVIPNGDLLPSRANYGPTPDDGNWSIGVNHVFDDEPRWYPIADVVASKIKTGRAPRVVRAIRFQSHRRQRGLRPTTLRGQELIDPADTDFFRHVVEARQRLKSAVDDHPKRCGCENCRNHRFLKILANAGSYGIYAEMIRHELAAHAREAVTVYGPTDQPFVSRVHAPESPGRYCFPPIAACITAAARLVLALIEHEVTAAGGTWMFCDTDSFAIVATEHGGLLPCAGGAHQLPDGTPAVLALSYAQVDHIRARLNALNPYDQALIPEILKLEKTGQCYAISAKRYVITDNTGRVTKRSEHGLGQLLDPVAPRNKRRDTEGDLVWVDKVWQWILAAQHDPDVALPQWAHLPAMSRITVSSTMLSRPFEQWNHDQAWAEQIKPFNFLLAATLDPLCLHREINPAKFRLIAPYESDPDRWQDMEWRNLHDPNGPSYRITTDPNSAPAPNLIVVKSYRNILTSYRVHPEHKFNAPDGTPCRLDTTGQLRRRTVRPAGEPHLIGKEANRLDDVKAGIVSNIDQVLTDYSPADRWYPDLVLPVLARYTGRELAALSNVDRRTIDRVRNGGKSHAPLRVALVGLAISHAAADLTALGYPLTPGHHLPAVLSAWRSAVRGRAAGR